MKKILIILFPLVIIVVLAYYQSDNSNKFKIGAILPLSGPASIWGENVKNGMELALRDFPEMKIIYEDSKGAPADGVTAFNLLDEKDTNINVSILSTVSVALSKLALEKKKPLLVTLTAADNIANEYTTRYYNDASNFAGTSFKAEDSPIKTAKNIAILYRNDDLGKSVFQQIQQLSAENGKQIVISESFNPNEKDFSTALTKIKSAGADVLMFTPVTPSEAVGIVKKANDLRFNIPLIEASNVFADLSNREAVQGITFYSNIYDFIKSKNGQEFQEKYRQKYNKEANFGAAFGYDVVNFIAKCKDSKEINSCLNNYPTNLGITGLSTQIKPGDFNIPLIFDRVN